LAENGRPRLVEPAGYSADAGLVASVLDELAQLRVERWVADAPRPEFGLSRPAARVAVERDGKAPWQLLMGRGTRGGRYATVVSGDVSAGDAVFVLPWRSVERFEQLLVDRGLLSFEPESVGILRLRTATAEWRFERCGNEWTLASGPPSADASSSRGEQAEELLLALSSIRAEGTVHLGVAEATEGFARPVLGIEVVESPAGSCAGGAPASAPRSQELRIGAGDLWQDTRVYYARVRGVDATFAVARAAIEEPLRLLR
jgi:hypothetical protein